MKSTICVALSPHEIPHFCCSDSICPSGDDRCSSRELAAFIKKTGSSPWPRTQHGTACRAMFLDVFSHPGDTSFLLSCHMGGVGWGNNVHVHLRRIGCMMIFSCTCKILQTHTETWCYYDGWLRNPAVENAGKHSIKYRLSTILLVLQDFEAAQPMNRQVTSWQLAITSWILGYKPKKDNMLLFASDIHTHTRIYIYIYTHVQRIKMPAIEFMGLHWRYLPYS